MSTGKAPVPGKQSILGLLDELDKAELSTHVQHLVVRLARAATAAQEVPHGTKNAQAHNALEKALEHLEQGLSELAQKATDEIGTSESDSKSPASANRVLQLAKLTHATRSHLKTERANQQRLQLAFADRVVREIESRSTELPHKQPSKPGQLDATDEVPLQVSREVASSSEITQQSERNPASSRTSPQSRSVKKGLSNALLLHQVLTEPSTSSPGLSMKELVQKVPELAAFMSARPALPPAGDLVRTLDTDLDTLAKSEDSVETCQAWSAVRAGLWDGALRDMPPTLSGWATTTHLESRMLRAEPFHTDKALELMRDIVSELARWTKHVDKTNLRIADPRRNELDEMMKTLNDGGTDEKQRLVTIIRQLVPTLSAIQHSPYAKGLSELEMQMLFADLAAANEQKLVRSICDDLAIRMPGVTLRGLCREWLQEHLEQDEFESWSAATAEGKMTLVVKATMSSVKSEHAISHLRYSQSDAVASAQSIVNFVPPFFLVTSPRLLLAQLEMEAATVVACLVALFGNELLSSISTTSSESTSSTTVATRLWVLLMDAAKERDSTPESTKVTHLADELVRASQVAAEAEGGRIFDRQAVLDKLERVLRYEDAVFKLLKRRLEERVQARVTMHVLDKLGLKTAQTSQVGTVASMKTASDWVKTSPSSPGLSINENEWQDIKLEEPVKGFELVNAGVESTIRELVITIVWSARVWFDEIAKV
ncbi:hypothetical protein OIV83_005442 [Microbotryomycetes sp. JL201]|nr:hypothetical protein OIV83_005442 [Microbotryomycetes sp. JL201]